MEKKISELSEGDLVLLGGCGNKLYHRVISYHEEKFMGVVSGHLVLETGKGKRFFKRLHLNYVFTVSPDNEAPLCEHHHQESEND